MKRQELQTGKLVIVTGSYGSYHEAIVMDTQPWEERGPWYSKRAPRPAAAGTPGVALMVKNRYSRFNDPADSWTPQIAKLHQVKDHAAFMTAQEAERARRNRELVAGAKAEKLRTDKRQELEARLAKTLGGAPMVSINEIGNATVSMNVLIQLVQLAEEHLAGIVGEA